MMNNWFYMDRMTFENVLRDELGQNLSENLISLEFDVPVSFMIGETAEEILDKIQESFTRRVCQRNQCHECCVSCSLEPPMYAKLIWFVQRLLIMSPLTKPFIKKTSVSSESEKNKNVSRIYQHVAMKNDQITQPVNEKDFSKNSEGQTEVSSAEDYFFLITMTSMILCMLWLAMNCGASVV